MKLVAIILVAIIFLTICILGCRNNSSQLEGTSGEEKTGKTKINKLTTPRVICEFAIYYHPKPMKDPLNELKRLLSDKHRFFHLVPTVNDIDKTDGPSLVTNIYTSPKEKYAPPDVESLRHFGRGLSKEDAEALQDTDQVFILTFAYSRSELWKALRSAIELTHSLATETDGFIWDEDTRLVFSTKKWEETLLKNWNSEIPDIANHTTIHAYNSGERVRAVTLGMIKFGLPDLVIDQFSWSNSRNMGHVINMVAQGMAEASIPNTKGDLDFDFRSIKHPAVRDPQMNSLKPNATGIAKLKFKVGKADEGDPENDLVEISFERGDGSDIFAKQDQILSEAFGWEDEVHRVKHTEELKKASENALKKLPQLQEKFNRGLAPGEYILLKASFVGENDQREWMWVEISTWNEKVIEGMLKNEPRYNPKLHAGQIVDISDKDLFDYSHVLPDGTTEGNETGKILESNR